MTDTRPYERLTALTSHLATEEPLDEWTWSNLFEYADNQAPASDQIAEVTHLWVISPEGYASLDIALMGRLTDGRWVTCVAWSDTSGFGCRQGVDWRINDSRESAISFGLDQESRRHLGLAMPGEENVR